MNIIPLSTWYPTMHTKWQARLAQLRALGVKVDFALDERIGWTIHHTVGGTGVNATAYARGVADQHWLQWRRPGGYNFMVGWDGQIREMCGLTHEGAHAGTNQWNEDTLGLAFQGTFTTTLPPRYMLDAVRRLIGVTEIPETQWGHRDVRPTPTTCPGGALYALLPLSSTMTKQEMLDTLGITAAELGAIKQLRAGAVAAGREISIERPMQNVFTWEIQRDFPGAGGGVSEQRVRQLIAGSDITPPD